MVIEKIIVIIKIIIIEIKIIKIEITLVTKGDIINMMIADGMMMAINKDKMIIITMIIITMIIMKTKCAIKEKIIDISIIKGLKDNTIIMDIKDNNIIIGLKDNNTKDRVNIIGKKIIKGKFINTPTIRINTKSKKDTTREKTNIKISHLDKKQIKYQSLINNLLC